jgi:flagellar biosynthetic protein FlhB
MPEERFDERTEPATPRRRQEARENGHVARSADLNAALVLLGALLALNFFGDLVARALMDALRLSLERLAEFDLTPENAYPLLLWTGLLCAQSLLPVLAVVFAVAVLANVVQVGVLVSARPLEPNLERLDPVEGMRRLLSLRGVARVGFTLVKAVAVGVTVWVTIRGEGLALLGVADLEVEGIAAYLARVLLLVGLRSALVLLALALLDYAYQRWQYEQDLRMSRQEIKEEMKRLEGDPQVRDRRRRAHRQLALQRMLQKVPKATVVITNPTHLAVALMYTREMRAPRCVAKGAGPVALRIREIAAAHKVPVYERPPLAQALYRAVDVDRDIPPELYQAVAEVLAYVYRQSGRAA